MPGLPQVRDGPGRRHDREHLDELLGAFLRNDVSDQGVLAAEITCRVPVERTFQTTCRRYTAT